MVTSTNSVSRLHHWFVPGLLKGSVLVSGEADEQTLKGVLYTADSTAPFQLVLITTSILHGRAAGTASRWLLHARGLLLYHHRP